MISSLPHAASVPSVSDESRRHVHITSYRLKPSEHSESGTNFNWERSIQSSNSKSEIYDAMMSRSTFGSPVVMVHISIAAGFIFLHRPRGRRIYLLTMRCDCVASPSRIPEGSESPIVKNLAPHVVHFCIPTRVGWF